MPEPRDVALVALRIAVAMLLVAGVGAIAHLPLGETPDGAALRVALRTPHAQIETCRDRTPEELAALPVHMRQLRICQINTIDYRLQVAIDGRSVVDRAVVHHGVRRNRPLVADVTVPAEPGAHRVLVRFAPTSPVEPAAGAPPLPDATFDADVDFPPGRIRVLTLGADGASFRLAG